MKIALFLTAFFIFSPVFAFANILQFDATNPPQFKSNFSSFNPITQSIQCSDIDGYKINSVEIWLYNQFFNASTMIVEASLDGNNALNTVNVPSDTFGLYTFEFNDLVIENCNNEINLSITGTFSDPFSMHVLTNEFSLYGTATTFGNRTVGFTLNGSKIYPTFDLMGSTTPASIISSVTTGVQDTTGSALPIALPIVGVPIAFIIGRYVVRFISMAV